jgi:hypothetical protein
MAQPALSRPLTDVKAALRLRLADNRAKLAGLLATPLAQSPVALVGDAQPRVLILSGRVAVLVLRIVLIRTRSHRLMHPALLAMVIGLRVLRRRRAARA